jgi:hypothetical protein
LLSLAILFSCFSIVLWALYQYVCIVCYTFNNYLTTLFDVYCMCYMRTMPTKCCTLPLAS